MRHEILMDEFGHNLLQWHGIKIPHLMNYRELTENTSDRSNIRPASIKRRIIQTFNDSYRSNISIFLIK